MEKIPSYELRNRMRDVLDRVWNGESFLITRNGVTVATLAPVPGCSGAAFTDTHGDSE